MFTLEIIALIMYSTGMSISDKMVKFLLALSVFPDPPSVATFCGEALSGGNTRYTAGTFGCISEPFSK
ncbi:hypothetical protein JCM16161A_09980 [Vulcanisaeta sp. JCM 16161]|uniref:hypothetical protein n=1 Tax=Vulcanisaeta sp. JCM 16161 TaxID=1295372 RepID=UPI0006D0E0DF|nr:hypothetical protein [Vulcanisaeta sp. JCM 16161]